MAQVIVEADGGSRGNPGPAAFGAVLIDAGTGAVIADRAETIGVATNNVAEYRGLIAGLELALVHAPGTTVEVRMDSKLVIEQMAGRWKIKHPDMKPLAMAANKLVRQVPQITWTWIPRERNKRADALVNAALDARVSEAEIDDVPTGPEPLEGILDVPESAEAPAQGWGASTADPTTLVMVRHGVTDRTERKLFSGSSGDDLGLNFRGRAQAERAASWLHHRESIDLIITSPARRTRETAEIIASLVDVPVTEDEGFAEADFGDWEGHSFREIMERWPRELDAWLASTAVAPPGGEDFDAVQVRVDAARERVLEAHPGKRIAIVSHVSPIKLVVRRVLAAPTSVLHTLEVAPASVTTTAWWPDGNRSLRNFSVQP